MEIMIKLLSRERRTIKKDECSNVKKQQPKSQIHVHYEFDREQQRHYCIYHKNTRSQPYNYKSNYLLIGSSSTITDVRSESKGTVQKSELN